MVKEMQTSPENCEGEGSKKTALKRSRKESEMVRQGTVRLEGDEPTEIDGSLELTRLLHFYGFGAGSAAELVNQGEGRLQWLRDALSSNSQLEFWLWGQERG